MDNKLSELSKPVDISNWKMDSWREAPCNGAEWAKGYFEGWNKYHSKVEEHAPLYSQEYVSALLADNERLASDLVARNGEIEGLRERAAELEASQLALKNVTELWNEQRQRIAELAEREKRVVALANGNDELWEAMAHRLKTLEDKLATPVRLLGEMIVHDWEHRVERQAAFEHRKIAWDARLEEDKKAILAAGFTFTVEGDE